MLDNSQIADFSAATIILGLGMLCGLADRRRFNFAWLITAIGMILLNNLLLARIYRVLPNVLGGDWNWTGKTIALAATLLIASVPLIGWRATGLTWRQRPGSLRAAMPVALAYCAFFAVIALAFPSEPPTNEDIAFQLTMPGLEEELFYRGILLFAFDRAFVGRVRLFGVDWGWGAVLSCTAFGLAHALGYADNALSFDPLVMALTALPSFIAIWLRYRTESVALPVLLHNFGNAIGLIL